MKHLSIFAFSVFSSFTNAISVPHYDRQLSNDPNMQLTPGSNIVATYSINKYSCSFVDALISNINNRMRAGYSAQEGEQLRDELRNLKNQRDKCKKKKHFTSE
jgi:hypothetical protein